LPKAARQPKSRAPKLTDKQRAFAREYTVDFDATQAAIRAGYSANGAGQTAHNLLKKTEIRALVREIIDRRAARTEVEAERVLLEAARIAFSDMRDYVEWDAKGIRLTDSKQLTDDAAAAILEISESVSAEGGRTRKIKLHPKTAALRDLMKHLGLFEKDNFQRRPVIVTEAERTQAYEEARRTGRLAVLRGGSAAGEDQAEGRAS